MIKEEFIRSLAEQHIAGTDKFIVDVKVKQGNRILVFVDADNGVTIADCAKLSRFIESNLDRNTEDFDLEVSSAGLDLPLILARQYKKNMGREVKVILKSGLVKTGILTNISEKELEITETIIEKINKKKEIRKVPVSLEFDQVKETRLVIHI
jgi:ribosome maturation factor RimP